MRRCFLLILFLCLIFAVACENEPVGNNPDQQPEVSPEASPETTTIKYSREYWGEWKKMDQSETWLINSTSIVINGAISSKDVVLAKPSANVISVTEEDLVYCLYAVRTASSTISGSITSQDTARAVGPIYKIIAQNIRDANDVTETSSDDNGSFDVDNLIVGEEYNIKIGDTSLTVKPSFDGEDIGNITLMSGVNFKVTLSNTNSVMYAGSQYYSMNLIIENIGDTNCSAATYSLIGDEGLEVINNYSDGVLLRTVAAGEKKTIPLRVRCDVPESETVIKKLNLTITDRNGTTWNDSVSLKFYRDTVTINVISENGRPISGVIIGDGRTYSITNRTNYSIEVPVTAESYLLVFSGAIANAERNTEAAYSVGVNRPATAAANLLAELGTGTNSYEPNDDENNAKSIIFGKSIVSYLFENDIDYYFLEPVHLWDSGVVTKEANCTEEGAVKYTCSVCGEIYIETIPATGHSYSSEWSKDADNHWHVSTCGHDVISDNAEHSWDDGIETLAPTHTVNGVKICTCTVCGATKTEVIPALVDAHSFSETWTNDETYHWHASTCGHDVVSEKQEHQWVADTIISESTKTTEGLQHFECSVCGQTKIEPLPMIPYEIGDVGPAGGYIFYDCDADNDSGNTDGLISTECGWRYLEVAPADLRVLNGVPTVDSTTPGYDSVIYVEEYSMLEGMFCTYRKTENGNYLYVNGTENYNPYDCTGVAIGTGKKNTTLLVSVMGNTPYAYYTGTTEKTGFYAARMCDLLEHSVNGVIYDDWFLPSRDELYTLIVQMRSIDGLESLPRNNYWSSSEDESDPEKAYSMNKNNPGTSGSSIERGYWFGIRPIRSFLPNEQNGHDYETSLLKTHSCTESGMMRYTCKTCGYSFEQVIPQTGHSFSDEWSKDADYHWHEATCGHDDEVSDKQAHDFGIDHVCTVCGFVDYSYMLETRIAGYYISIVSVKNEYYSSIPSKLSIPSYIDGYEVKSIEDRAFYNNPNLAEIILPNSLVSLGTCALADNSNLQRVVIGENLLEIGTNPFINSNNIEEIVVDNRNSKFSSIDGVLYDKNITVLLYCPTQKTGIFEVPSTVVEIGRSAFSSCEKLTEIILSESVATLNEYSFYGCSGLSSFSIPDNVESIPDAAFYRCSNLQTIEIGKSVNRVGESAFLECPNLTQIIIDCDNMNYSAEDGILYNKDKTILIDYPAATGSVTLLDSIIQIGRHSIGSTTITDLIISGNTTTIGDYAIAFNYSLKSVTIPDSITSIGEQAFRFCRKLSTINYLGTMAQWYSIEKGDGWKEEVPDSCIVHCTDGDISI